MKRYGKRYKRDPRVSRCYVSSRRFGLWTVPKMKRVLCVSLEHSPSSQSPDTSLDTTLKTPRVESNIVWTRRWTSPSKTRLPTRRRDTSFAVFSPCVRFSLSLSLSLSRKSVCFPALPLSPTLNGFPQSKDSRYASQIRDTRSIFESPSPVRTPVGFAGSLTSAPSLEAATRRL